MNEDNIQPQQPASDPKSTSDPIMPNQGSIDVNSDDSASERVFDITPDLNISPFQDKDMGETATPPTSTPTQIPKPPTQSSMQTPRLVTPTSTTPPSPDRYRQNPAEDKRPMPVMNDPNIKPIRTFEGDVKELMSHKRTSVTNLVMAEKEKKIAEVAKPGSVTPGSVTPGSITNRESPYETSHNMRNILLVLLSIILIGGGALAAYFLYSKSPVAPAPSPSSPKPQVPTGLVPSDSTAIIPIDGLNESAAISKIKLEIAKPQPVNTIKEIIPVITQKQNLTRISAPDMLLLTNIPVPNILARSLNNNWMLGVYADSDGQKSTFVVSTNNFFQNTFAGMLQWESIMPTDLKSFISTNQGQFINKTINNKDVREYMTASGQVLFLYSFIDSNTMVFSGSELALAEIMKRLEKQAYIR